MVLIKYSEFIYSSLEDFLDNFHLYLRVEEILQIFNLSSTEEYNLTKDYTLKDLLRDKTNLFDVDIVKKILDSLPDSYFLTSSYNNFTIYKSKEPLPLNNLQILLNLRDRFQDLGADAKELDLFDNLIDNIEELI